MRPGSGGAERPEEAGVLEEPLDPHPLEVEVDAGRQGGQEVRELEGAGLLPRANAA